MNSDNLPGSFRVTFRLNIRNIFISSVKKNAIISNYE